MKANNTTSANLKGMAKHTYNRVMSAIVEDNGPSMCHTFAALTDGAKSIVLQSGKFSNLYIIRGERKGMAAEEAAKELTERAAACVSRKLRKIDMICAVAFLAEYISRQRKEDEPKPTEPNNTPTTMNANEVISAAIIAELNTRKDRSAWDKGVTEYATELAESLGNWDKQPESVTELREMMLNGADDWKAYS